MYVTCGYLMWFSTSCDLFWADLFSSSGDSNGSWPIELPWELNELIYVKCVKEGLASGKHCISICYSTIIIIIIIMLFYFS